MLLAIHLPHRGVIDPFPEVFDKIPAQRPGQGADGIQGEHVEELKAMCRQPFLGGALSQKRAMGNIIIDTVDIGESVMDDIVLDLPDVGVTAQRIHSQPHDTVYPFFVREAVVTGIVHDIECYADKDKSQEDGDKYPAHPAIMTQQEV